MSVQIPNITEYDSDGRLIPSGLVTLDTSTNDVVKGPITTSGLTESTNTLLGRSTASTGAIKEITVGSNLTLSAGVLSATGGASFPLTAPDGSNSAPSYSFGSHTNTGMFLSGTNLAFTVSGTTLAEITSIGIASLFSLISSGSASNPPFNFSNSLNTGIFSPAAANLGITTGGTERLRVTSTGLAMRGTSTIDLNSNKITSLATPTTSTDAANKSYVDAGLATAGIIHQPGTIGPLKYLAYYDIQANELFALTGPGTGRLWMSSSEDLPVASSVTDSDVSFLAGNTITSTELSYLSGVTSAIQTQLDTKALNGSITTSGLTQNSSKLLGRTTASTGAVEEITIGSGLTMSSGTLSATGGGGGGVANIAQGTSSANETTTSTTFVNTSLTVTITPTSATSKILITLHANGQQNTTSNATYFTLDRNGTELSGNANGFQFVYFNNFYVDSPFSIVYLDSPATTSPVTYTLQFRVSGGTGTLQDITSTAVIVAEEKLQ